MYVAQLGKHLYTNQKVSGLIPGLCWSHAKLYLDTLAYGPRFEPTNLR